MSLIRKTVRINDVTRIQFFYPEYEIRDGLNMLDYDKKIIYVGALKPGLVGKLDKGTESWINTVGPYDIDLTSRRALVDFVFGKHGKQPPKKLLEGLDAYDEGELWRFLKIAWLVGMWKGDADEGTVLDILFNLTSDFRTVITLMFKVMEEYDVPPAILESSVLTFLLRAKNLDEQDVSGRYLAKLTSFASGSRKGRIVPAVGTLASWDRTILDEVRILKLLLDLRG